MRSITGSVAPPPEGWAGAPRVIISGCPNKLKEAMMVVMIINRRTGRSMGTVMRVNICQEVEPSIEAASYRKSGMSWRAARRMIILKPTVHQTVAITMVTQAHGSVASQLGPRMPHWDK